MQYVRKKSKEMVYGRKRQIYQLLFEAFPDWAFLTHITALKRFGANRKNILQNILLGVTKQNKFLNVTYINEIWLQSWPFIESYILFNSQSLFYSFFHFGPIWSLIFIFSGLVSMEKIFNIGFHQGSPHKKYLQIQYGKKKIDGKSQAVKKYSYFCFYFHCFNIGPF